MAKEQADSDSGDRFALDTLAKRREQSQAMGGDARIAKQHERGKLTARERIERLIDPGSFEEYGALVQSEIESMRDRTPADGKIAGFATIGGRPVVVHADDATVLAGAGGRNAMVKIKRSHDYAVRKGYPVVYLGDAGGVRMPDNMGAANMMRMSDMNYGRPRNRRVPVVATIMGQCYGDPSWNVARADVAVMVKSGVMAVSGPKVIANATGEAITPEALGGWELHAKTTGQVDLFAEDEDECLELVRRVLSYFPSNADSPGRRLAASDE
jgi:acetyl-CoA carboxylase carboxyltransferase component